MSLIMLVEAEGWDVKRVESILIALEQLRGAHFHTDAQSQRILPSLLSDG